MRSLTTKAAAALALAIGVLMLGGCESTDLIADPSGEIRVTASPSTVVIDDSVGATEAQTTIVAQVFDEDGFAMEDVSVLFTTTGGVLASADAQGVPTTVKTDANGIATDRLTVNVLDISPIEVTARSGSLSGQATVRKEVTSGQLLLSANPAEVAVDGFSAVSREGTTQLEARVLAADSSPRVGALVSFTTTGGTLDARDATTDSDGRAGTMLTVRASDAPFVDVTARSGNVSDVQTITINTGSVDVTATPTTITINTTMGQTEGQSTIQASLTRGDGSAASGVTVSFSTTAGTLSTRTGTTDGTGRASVVLTLVQSDPNSVSVTASAGTESDSVTVTKNVVAASS